jgi:Icc-related predicted phosphoesterase
VLLTHGPPYGIGDAAVHYDEVTCRRNIYHGGCPDLCEQVQNRIKPLVHVFGHIHEGHGTGMQNNTLYINAAILDEDYRAVNHPIVFDLSL